MESFGGPARFREKVFTGAVAERSSVPIKQEAIVDPVNISGDNGASAQMDCTSTGEDVKVQGAIKDGSDDVFEIDKYIKDSSVEVTEAITE